MLQRFLPTSKSTEGSVNYNERKVDRGVAERVAVRNIDSNDRYTIEMEFEKLRRGMIQQSNKVSFHLSLSPGDTDRVTEKEMLEIIDKVMDRLGYKNQPYVIYRHQDTGRIHYHIVSSSIDKTGHKIDCWKDQYKCKEILQELSRQYDYTYSTDTEQKKERPVVHPIFPAYAKQGNICGQINSAFDEALKFKFTTIQQFRQVMALMNVEVSEHLKESCDNLHFYLLDENGQKCTSMIEEMDLGRPKSCQQQFVAKMAANIKERPLLRAEKARTSNNIGSCFKYARNENQFYLMLRNKGILFIPSRNDKNEVFGGTFIDMNNRVCFKASEIPKKDFNISEYRTRCETGNWPGVLRDIKKEPAQTVDQAVDKKMSDYKAGRKDLAAAQQEGERFRENIRQLLGKKMPLAPSSSGGSNGVPSVERIMEEARRKGAAVEEGEKRDILE